MSLAAVILVFRRGLTHSLALSLARFTNSPMQQTVVGQSDRSIDEAHQVPLGHAISAEHIH